MNVTDLAVFKSTLPESVPILREALDEIQHSIEHLERSNREIQEFIVVADDPEMTLAIEENAEALLVKQDRLNAIKEKIEEQGGSMCVSRSPGPQSSMPRILSFPPRQRDEAPSNLVVETAEVHL
ncbi:MAG: uncharacterized protein KVP18_005143 [Porospora cf. gigantea A]|uniref:uncharacterized protein n=1 Tax=Porospora cf. gigantea A TaxID=2853593 RepID=UPI003559531D|nr:MAG: hypothetical protein KVP18_005143 [Porospora cf. gigantea A]